MIIGEPSCTPITEVKSLLLSKGIFGSLKLIIKHLALQLTNDADHSLMHKMWHRIQMSLEKLSMKSSIWLKLLLSLVKTVIT